MTENQKQFEDGQEKLQGEIDKLREQVEEMQRQLSFSNPRPWPPRPLVPRRDEKREFIEAHGGQASMIRVSQKQYLLPTGAHMMLDGAMYQLQEPPVDEWQNNRARRAYAVAKLERSERDFNLLKASLSGMTNEYGMPTTWAWDEREYGDHPNFFNDNGLPDGESALSKLKRIVKERRQAVKDIDGEPIAVHRKEVETMRQRGLSEAAARESDRRARINSIRI